MMHFEKIACDTWLILDEFGDTIASIDPEGNSVWCHSPFRHPKRMDRAAVDSHENRVRLVEATLDPANQVI